jgi:hypothetical protein
VTTAEPEAAGSPVVAEPDPIESDAATPAATPEPLRSKLQQILRKAANETFPEGWDNFPTPTIIERASDHRDVKALKRPSLGSDTWNRALGRRKD